MIKLGREDGVGLEVGCTREKADGSSQIRPMLLLLLLLPSAVPTSHLKESERKFLQMIVSGRQLSSIFITVAVLVPYVHIHILENRNCFPKSSLKTDILCLWY